MSETDKQPKSFAQLYGFAAIGSSIEHVFMHPIDTSVRRIQNHRHPVNRFNLRSVLFPEVHTTKAFAKFASVYTGFFSAGSHKAMVRSYKYGTQPFAVALVDHYAGSHIKKQFGEKVGGSVIEGSAGCLIGGVEALFTPIDSFKIKRQIGNTDSLWKILKTERFHLFNGTGIAIARNVPGSFALFSVSSAMKARYEKQNLEKEKTHLSFTQHLVSSAVGSVSASVVTNPQDVIKTRVMAATGRVSTLGVLSKTIRHEGMSALWKGLLLRATLSIPKLGLPMTFAFFLPEVWDRVVEDKKLTKPKP